MAQQQLQPGAGVILRINGSVVGFATALSFSRSQNIKVIHEIDNPFARELAPTTYSVSGSLGGFRVRDQGGLDGPGIMDISTIQSFFYQKYAVIEVVDRLSNKVLYTIQKVLFENDSWTVQARGIITFSANFRGIFISNEVGDGS